MTLSSAGGAGGERKAVGLFVREGLPSPVQGQGDQLPHVRRVRVRSQLRLPIMRRVDPQRGSVPALQVAGPFNLATVNGT